MVTPAGSTTLRSALATARQRLIDAGIRAEEAAVDVDLFARVILDWDRARLLTELLSPAPEALEPRLSDWLARRAAREPSAYIVGFREFWSRDFIVSPAVLIPRPETEFIVEEALRLLSESQPVRIADLGTGSGCIAVSIACDRPHCQVVATDVSAEALEVAQRNAARHGVAGRVAFACTPYLDGIEGPFDVIVANPPYVRDGDKPGLSRDVRYEPDVALFGGATGLRDIERTMDAVTARLRPHGWFVMEFGFGQEDDVRRLLAARPAFRLDHVRADLQGLARVVVAQIIRS
jgi:release factor glutamine methyltransferase